ncbi:MAG: hypothetical protein M3R55_00480 [Acidobacteriota bacterium]|nr:hypothetical protein [Acidobacteriota bacterium]
MVPDLRRRFNERFTAEGYQRFLADVGRRAVVPIEFRVSETPCFFTAALMDELAGTGRTLVEQLTSSAEYMRASDATIPAEFNAPGEGAHPLFVQVDFGLTRDADGRVRPKLVELQAFASLYEFQPALAETYRESWGLPEDLQVYFGGMTRSTYQALLGGALLNGHDPDRVVLMEIEPLRQKTRPDFALTEKQHGIRAVDIREIVREGRRLFYRRDGRLVPIARIYNRTILDELQRKQLEPPFDYRDDLDVEWAGHPNWYFRLSKFSLPWLKHESVPRAWFLSELDRLPGERDDYLLKPLYSFAGTGIVFGPTEAELDAIPAVDRDKYLIQERVRFEPVIETPHGATQAEIRVMYLWTDRLTPVLPLLRMGRGRMMGVDQNRNLEWVGASAGLIAG